MDAAALLQLERQLDFKQAFVGVIISLVAIVFASTGNILIKVGGVDACDVTSVGQHFIDRLCCRLLPFHGWPSSSILCGVPCCSAIS